MSYTDRILTCRGCGSTFPFTAGEQEFFAQKGFTNEPSRCPACRAARKSQPGGGGTAYDQERDSARSAYRREPRQMYTATCSQCGGVAELPFEPRSDKPVYCARCFEPRRSQRY